MYLHKGVVYSVFLAKFCISTSAGIHVGGCRHDTFNSHSFNKTNIYFGRDFQVYSWALNEILAVKEIWPTGLHFIKYPTTLQSHHPRYIILNIYFIAKHSDTFWLYEFFSVSWSYREWGILVVLFGKLVFTGVRYSHRRTVGVQLCLVNLCL